MIWQPSPGSQTLAMTAPVQTILYSGGRGNGKSDCQIMRFRKSVGVGYGKYWRGLITDRTYGALDDLVSKTKRYFPQFDDGAKFYSSKGDYRWVFKTGEELLFRSVANEDDYQKLHGQEFTFIGVNEVSQYPDLSVVDLLTSLNRSSFVPSENLVNGKMLPEIPLCIFLTSNPSGRGAIHVKKRYVDAGLNGEIVKRDVKIFNPRTQQDETITKTQVHIFGSYRENTKLSPEYVADLESIIDPLKRLQWLKGCWDSCGEGSMFEAYWDSKIHVIDSFDIPANWKIDRTYDHGESAPFAVQWWAESNGEDVKLRNGKTRSTIKGDLFLINEYYGCVDGMPSKGLKMLAHDIATEIVKRELMWGIHDRVRPGAADNSIYITGNGNCIAASMNQPITIDGRVYEGVTWTRSDKSKGTRVAGLELFKNRLTNSKTTLDKPYREKEGIFIFKECTYFIDIIPSMARDDNNPDDVDGSNDHQMDCCRYKLLSTRLGSRSGRTTGLN